MKFFTFFISFFVLFNYYLFCSFAQETTQAPLYIYDLTNDLFLKKNNIEQKFNPASFTKLMTAKIILDQIKNKKLDLNTKIKITEDVWKKGGAPSGGFTMFAKPNTEISVYNLLCGLIIDNANDAALALSNYVAKNQENFTNIMNKEAQNLHMNNSFFVSSTGQSYIDQQVGYSTLKDLMILFKYLVKNYKLFNDISANPNFTWNNITQYNRNILPIKLAKDIHFISGWTAYNKELGYMILTATTKNRLIFAGITGLLSKSDRVKITESIVKDSFNNFKKILIFKNDKPIKIVKVYSGLKNYSTIGIQKDFYQIIDITNSNFSHITLKYNEPLTAPIKKGEKIGEIVSTTLYGKTQKIDLISLDNNNSVGFFKKFKLSLYNLTIGWLLDTICSKFAN